MSSNWNDLKDGCREGNKSGKDDERVVLMQGEMGVGGGGGVVVCNIYACFKDIRR